jgi:N-acetylglucosamine malate deacetylase 1
MITTMIKLDILAIGVHPDDVELSCSGTLLKHIAAGHKIGLLDLTRGELGTRGSAETRDVEAENARVLMGALVRENARMADGFFTHNEENIRKIITVIRQYQPSIVLLNAIDDRHPDHGRAAKLASDACFLSGLRKIETFDNQGIAQKEWRPSHVYHYVQDRSMKADFVVDITPFVAKKEALILTYKTQFSAATNQNDTEPQTPISTPTFLESVKAKDRVYGRLINAEYGEAFVAERPLGIENLFDLR